MHSSCCMQQGAKAKIRLSVHFGKIIQGLHIIMMIYPARILQATQGHF